MRRLPVHGLFAAGALGLGLVVALQAWQLRAQDRLALAVQQGAAGAPPAGVPQARLAQALALAAAGDYDAAATAYKELTGATGAGEATPQASAAMDVALRQTALYDLGNLNLRTALKAGDQEAIRSLPLIELAKHSYREVLFADPQDWDARYNLERALWLAPEFDEGEDAVDRPSGPRERAATTMQGSQGDLP